MKQLYNPMIEQPLRLAPTHLPINRFLGQPPARVSDSDEALMAAFAQGQAQAFEWLYARHRAWLLRVLRLKLKGYGGGEHWAEDIAQETWLTLVRHSAAYEPKAKFTTWLYQLAQHRLIDGLRSAARRPSLALAHQEAIPDGDEASAEEVSTAPFDVDLRFDPSELVERKQLAALIEQELHALPEAQREVFALVTYADMTVPEVAQALGIGLEVAKSRLRYARAKLIPALEALRP